MDEIGSLPDEVRATLPAVVAAYIAALEAAVQTLTTRVAALEARVGQNSSNSSRPPSSDPPRPAAQREPGRRRAGGQPGHRGTFRVLAPEAEVTAIQRYVPTTCARCGRALAAVTTTDDLPDQRHQVVEVAPVM